MTDIDETDEKPTRRPISRRTFLRTVATAVGGTLVAACGPVRSTTEGAAFLGSKATPQIILPSPMPAESADATPTPTVDDNTLAEFLWLSALLTGVPDLDPGLGRVYLRSLQTSEEFGGQVDDLIVRAGLRSESVPDTLDELEATGIFDESATGTLAQKIIELWYTGIYTNEDGEEVVATYVDALAWQTLRFTKPKSVCGYPGFWSEPWNPEDGALFG